MAGTRVLAKEEDHARTLLGSLSQEQMALAVISNEAPDDILTTTDRVAGMQENRGVASHQLDAQQRDVLWSLIEEYARVQPPQIAAERLQKIRAAGLDDIRFAWRGARTRVRDTTTASKAQPSWSSMTTCKTTPIMFTACGEISTATSAWTCSAAHYIRFPHGRANAAD